MKIRLRKLAMAGMIVLALGGAVAALVLYSGAYNIAATAQHTRLVFRVLDYAMHRSVIARSDPIVAPDLRDAARIRRGAVTYRDHCAQCHGAPGIAPDPLAFGLNPQPANLVGTARTWKPEDMFWVVKHGVKMSGMPAWAYRLDDEAIWSVVAFVVATVAMTPADYAAMARELPAPLAAATAPVLAPADAAPVAAATAAGDANAGRRATEQHLCPTCHVIPGIVGADRHVGPPLNGMGRRSTIAGVVANTPENMVRWLINPQQFAPASAMPPMRVSEQDARDIAAFLATLDDVE
jgi:mono/diheme cytochrome c family protein